MVVGGGPAIIRSTIAGVTVASVTIVRPAAGRLGCGSGLRDGRRGWRETTTVSATDRRPSGLWARGWRGGRRSWRGGRVGGGWRSRPAAITVIVTTVLRISRTGK